MSKLFDKWELDEVKIEDLGLVKYICLDETLVPHTSGRHVKDSLQNLMYLSLKD